MAEANWAKVLQAVYDTEDTGGQASLEASTNLSAGAVEEGLMFLERHGLISAVEDPVLTEKGFDVARQREMQRAQFEMNLFLAVFTFILSLAIVLQAVYQLRGLGLPGVIIGGGLLLATFVLFYFLERRTDVLKILLDGR